MRVYDVAPACVGFGVTYEGLKLVIDVLPNVVEVPVLELPMRV